MKSIKTLETKNLCESAKNGGCGECQTSCQSACKTSCGIANQQCENESVKRRKARLFPRGELYSAIPGRIGRCSDVIGSGSLGGKRDV